LPYWKSISLFIISKKRYVLCKYTITLGRAQFENTSHLVTIIRSKNMH